VAISTGRCLNYRRTVYENVFIVIAGFAHFLGRTQWAVPGSAKASDLRLSCMLGWEDRLSVVSAPKAHIKRTIFSQHSIQVDLTILIYNMKVK